MGLGAALGYMAGGALEGYGKGIVDDARALRDARLQELADQRRNDFQMQRDERDMSFRREEGRLDREMRLSEGEANRAAQGRQYMSADDGSTMVVEGDKARPVLGPDGKPLRFRPKAQNETDFDKKFRIGLEIYGGDKRKAADYAAGVRGADAQDVEKMAQDLAKSRATGPAGIDGKRFNEELPKARDEIKRILLGESTVPEQKPGAAPDTSAVLKQAQEAIARGAPRDAVMQRLKEMGIDTSKVEF